jgi:hypothetical protein
MGIRSSYIPEARDSASDFVDAINHVLNSHGQSGYIDPIDPPNVYNGHRFGRSELDHHSSRVIQKIAGIGCSARNSPNLALIYDNPFRVAYVPIDFTHPSPTAIHDSIGGKPTQIWVGSLPHLLEELRGLGADLGIPLTNGDITEETAAAINDWKSLYVGDSLELAEDETTAWLAIYEGARLASEHNVALSLAG